MTWLEIPLSALLPTAPVDGVSVIDLRVSLPQLEPSPHLHGAAHHVGDALSGTEPELVAWSAAVDASPNPCLLIDRRGVVVAISATAADILHGDRARMVGLPLAALVVAEDLGDPAGGPAPAHRLPPLASLARNVLTRGLVRLRHAPEPVSMDMTGAPLHSASHPDPIGVLSFMMRL